MPLPAGPALITLGTALLLFGCSCYAGICRARYRIAAPAVTGHPQFEIAQRIHANTLENALPFLAVLWVCALTLSAAFATVLGALWLASRVGYAIGYARQPRYRAGGFLLSMLAFGALGAGGAWGLLRPLAGG